MLYNTKQFYTPALEAYELNERALLIDTETIGAGAGIEIIEIAFGDAAGNIIYESLVQPVFNQLPPPSKHKRFDKMLLMQAPCWTEIWPEISALIENRLLVAYNASFDRRALAATCSRYRQVSQERGWRCAMQLIKKETGMKRSLPLSEACAAYGLTGGNHRAGADVQATWRLLKAATTKRDAA
ncbi:MAG: 3'-5' exonuclease [Pyrinomonadaceae bacterium]